MNKKTRKDLDEPDCCFNCRSYSPRKGRKGIGYCMRRGGSSKPKDICEHYRPVLARMGKYV